jgi:6-phosphofructokinase 1
LGGYATELISKKEFGKMVRLRGNEISSIPLEKVAGKLKLVTPDHDLIIQGKRMGISFGV